MNIEMDTLPKATIDALAITTKCYTILGKPWICYIAGWRLMHQVGPQLREHIKTITIKKH